MPPYSRWSINSTSNNTIIISNFDKIPNFDNFKALVDKYEVGKILHHRFPKDLAKSIKELSPENYAEALKKAKKELTWTIEKRPLQALLTS